MKNLPILIFWGYWDYSPWLTAGPLCVLPVRTGRTQRGPCEATLLPFVPAWFRLSRQKIPIEGARTLSTISVAAVHVNAHKIL